MVSKSRPTTDQTSQATPRPAPTARAPSRALRSGRLSAGVSFGRKLSASSSRMVVTTSTEIWVSARSGADR